MNKIVFLVAALAAAPLAAQADTLALWNFNSTVPDNSTSTGSTLPAVGSGTASLVGGVTSPGFNSGAGSSDPETSDDSGWQTTTYAAQGAGNKTRGVQFSVSTLGFENIVFSYDLRHSNTSSRYEAVQYTLNGSNWVDAATFDGNAGDTWFNLRTLDLSSVRVPTTTPASRCVCSPPLPRAARVTWRPVRPAPTRPTAPGASTR